MKQYGLIGFPLTHSFSPNYFKQLFAKKKLDDYRYDAYEIDSLNQLESLIHSHQLLGINVTIPYKKSILPFLHFIHPAALRIGAVNCIYIDHAKGKPRLIGFNTDYIGFSQTLTPHLRRHHKKALILGSGGSSSAVQYALSKLHIPFQVVSRASLLSKQYISYHQLTSEYIDAHKLIINTTPLGMYPDMDKAPDIPYEAISTKHLLYDLIYNPSETLFLARGKTHGAQTLNGYDMLSRQADESWHIWQTTSVFWD
ncbi:MAG: shikimate dehydrogenase [Flavobacteriales bacterium]|nr:shikimate dehydrogenase [Flavobacteriales bacterium]MCZ2443991.1 shikimate dehydrogenase [Flavobacteriales bacterium]